MLGFSQTWVNKQKAESSNESKKKKVRRTKETRRKKVNTESQIHTDQNFSPEVGSKKTKGLYEAAKDLVRHRKQESLDFTSSSRDSMRSFMKDQKKVLTLDKPASSPRRRRRNRVTANQAEENRKKHISYLCRRNPKKYRIILFSQKVAAKKIQRKYRHWK